MPRVSLIELDRLCTNVDPKSKLPRRFDLWTKPMQIMWLRQNQKPARKKGKS